MLSRLFRGRLALMNGVAAVGGGLLFPAQPEAGLLGTLFLGTALLAAGGSALNQYLERDLDRLMLRTCTRPLPTGVLSPGKAVAIGAACLVTGIGLLAFAAGPLPPFLGAAGIGWYLGVYTPLKRRTSLALALGALCGAVPPLMGWVAAGGRPTDPVPLFLAGLLYLWQVPHFWLLQRRHADDYRRAGFRTFDPGAVRLDPALFQLLWIVALVAATLMLPAFGAVGRNCALCCVVLCLPLAASISRKLSPVFTVYLNLFPLLVAVSLWFGSN
jgi:protoheme IX farnesyltransferase